MVVLKAEVNSNLKFRTHTVHLQGYEGNDHITLTLSTHNGDDWQTNFIDAKSLDELVFDMAQEWEHTEYFEETEFTVYNRRLTHHITTMLTHQELTDFMLKLQDITILFQNK